jgi:cell division protein ZapA (FtsZ GTPase activity inhibitor)
MNDNDQSFVRVSIFGQEYTVKAQADSRYIADVAEYVDSKMNEVSADLPSHQSELRIAILTAMGITDEMFSLRREGENIVADVEERATSMIELIDETVLA